MVEILLYQDSRSLTQNLEHSPTIANKLTAVLVISSSVLLTATPSLAGSQYTSKDGNLTVQYGNKCSTTKPTGTYRVRNGVTGNLTALDCSNTGGDISDHKFEDISGKERCYGQMRHLVPQNLHHLDDRRSHPRLSLFPSRQNLHDRNGQRQTDLVLINLDSFLKFP